MPSNCIFADKGPAVFLKEDNAVSIFALAAIVNSKSFGALVRVQLARTELAQSFEVGLIQQTPVPDLSPINIETFAMLAKLAWQNKRKPDTANLTSHAFICPALTPRSKHI
ncbi:MAG: hypothetical protein KJO21_01140 [Verrucomicrobiae bacterium]|nr:hypothetical protein [Verrucomicrobiae bacterium]NNJ42139.1 hypothetical protein [Akkermansiaceae bacterium]